MTINKKFFSKQLFVGLLIGCLFGAGIGIVGSKLYSLILFEQFENYWVPQLESSDFKLTETSPSFFLNPDFKVGKICPSPEKSKEILEKLHISLQDPSSATCSEFTLSKGMAYFIDENIGSYLAFQPNNEQLRLVLHTSKSYPMNNMIVRSSGRDEIVVFQEGYNNPAKTLYLQLK